MLISFEGIDGCGKSTQIDKLKSYLDHKSINYHIYREPGGTEISEKIRSLLLHESTEMDPVTELLLFSAARSQLISEKIIPHLRKNEIVILDRFFDSTTAYQGYGREFGEIEQIRALNKIATKETVPDITFYLRIVPKKAAERTIQTDKDRMENSGVEFFNKVVDGYDKIASEQERFVIIDADQSVDEIHQQIVNLLSKMI